MTAGFPSCNCLHNLSRKWRVTALSVSKSGDSPQQTGFCGSVILSVLVTGGRTIWQIVKSVTILFFRLTPSFPKKSEVILIQHLAKRALCYALIAFIIAETSK